MVGIVLGLRAKRIKRSGICGPRDRPRESGLAFVRALADDKGMDISLETLPDRFRAPDAASAIAAIAASYERLLGKSLVEPGADAVRALWEAPQVILAHGVQADPVFYFGNRAALACFETDLDTLLAMPSRLSAEAPLREERQALLNRVARHGFIDDYAGVRISANGRRFRIERAVVWTVSDEAGRRFGQAAAFTP